jgi:signal transduction histidine kinase
MLEIVLTDTGKLDETATSIIEMIKRASQRMKRLVDDLLDIARFEGEKLELQQTLLELGPMLTDALAEQQRTADKRGVALDCHVPPSLPLVLGDRDVLQRVIINLLDNALKFTPRGGQVWLEAREEDEQVKIEVLDTGPGIPLNERERIFEKFTQVQGREGTVRGSGLGLTFCRMAVETHGGRIWVEDGPGGKGSLFVLTLPLA